jgi:hypothetical protein
MDTKTQVPEGVTIWKPHPGPQEFALMQPDNTFELLYGGARGGGKTDAGLVWLTDGVENLRYRGLVVRRSATDLADWLDRARWMYKSLGAEVVGNPPEIRFPSGAIIRTGHLKDEQAYTKYQGHEYQRMLIEELTQIPSEERYLKFLSSCRSTVDGLRARFFGTTNPGGVGHGWVKRRFVSPAQPMKRFADPISGRLRIFIPASVDDNPTLMQKDPDYVMGLEALRATNDSLYKAWRHGSWDVPVGQFFTEWLQQRSVKYTDGSTRTIPWHVSKHFQYGLEACEKIIGFDWGYTAPGCAIWLARTPENRFGVRRVHAYRELYLTQTDPEAWARKMATFCRVDGGRTKLVLPHDCFSARLGAETIAETFRRVFGEYQVNVSIVRGETLTEGARINRAAITHRYLSAANDQLPYLQVHPNCRFLIETLPELVHDDSKPEDVDTEGEDHAYDALSLGLMTFGWRARKSEALRHEQTGILQPTWRPDDRSGTIYAGDFTKAFRDGLADQRGPSNPENRL